MEETTTEHTPTEHASAEQADTDPATEIIASPVPQLDQSAEYDESRIDEEFWPKLKRVVASVPGISNVYALYCYLKSGRASVRDKAAIVASLAYFLIPTDLIPDFIPGLGYVDDVAVAVGLIKFMGSQKLEPYRAYARLWLKGDTEEIEPSEIEAKFPAEVPDPAP